jgi:hypothetical protein
LQGEAIFSRAKINQRALKDLIRRDRLQSEQGEEEESAGG